MYLINIYTDVTYIYIVFFIDGPLCLEAVFRGVVNLSLQTITYTTHCVNNTASFFCL